MKKVEVKHLAHLLEHAKNRLLQSPPQVRLVGAYRPLTDGERLALCYFEAAMTVLGGMGIDTSEVVIERDDSVHDPV